MKSLMTTLPFRKPFAWVMDGTVDRSIVDTFVMGGFIAFWCSFTTYGGNQVVAQKLGDKFVPIPILVFYGSGLIMTVVTEELSHHFSKRTIITAGLSLMAMGSLSLVMVSNLTLFVLIYLMMGVGYFPTISSTAALCFSYLPKSDRAIERRGRNSFASINYGAASVAALAIPIVVEGHHLAWMILGMLSTIGASYIIWSMKSSPADDVVPVDDPNKVKPSLFRRMVDVQVLQTIWPYGFVVTCAQLIAFFLVFFIGVWATAVIFCQEIGNALSGLMLIQVVEKIDAKNPLNKERGDKIMAMLTLLGLIIGMLLIQTGNVPLCIVAGLVVGMSLRAANFSYSQLGAAKKTNPEEGVYTYFALVTSGQCSQFGTYWTQTLDLLDPSSLSHFRGRQVRPRIQAREVSHHFTKENGVIIKSVAKAAS